MGLVLTNFSIKLHRVRGVLQYRVRSSLDQFRMLLELRKRMLFIETKDAIVSSFRVECSGLFRNSRTS